MRVSCSKPKSPHAASLKPARSHWASPAGADLPLMETLISWDKDHGTQLGKGLDGNHNAPQSLKSDKFKFDKVLWVVINLDYY